MNKFSLHKELLRKFDKFEGASNIAFQYDFECEGFKDLISKYEIDKIAGNGSEINKVLNLMEWCSNNVLHNGGLKDVEFINKNSIDILNYSFGKGKEYGVYCRLQAIVFTECCLSLGLKSRILHCLPYSSTDFESHVVSIVYINEFDKWIMLDAGNNRYFVDENNIILSPIETRFRIANDMFIKCNENDDGYITYMAKNLFYFKSLQINTFGSDEIYNQDIYCVPTGFDVLKREIEYCEYAISCLPNHLSEDWKKQLIINKSKTNVIVANEKCFFSI